MRLLAAGETDEIGVVPLVDHLRELAHVGADRQIGMIDVAKLVRVGMDVDQRLSRMIRRDQRVAVGRRFPEASADGQDQVGIADALLQLRIGPVAELARHRPRRCWRSHPAAGRLPRPECRAGTRSLRSGARSRAPVRAADDRNRGGCLLQQLEHRLHGAGIRLLGDRRNARTVGRLDLVAQHVFRKREHDRAGPAGGRDAVGAVDIFGDPPRILDPRGPFGDRAEEGREVDFLEAFAVAVAARDVADEQDHRGRILEGDVDACGRVGRAGAAGDEGDARPSGHLPVRVRHVGDAAFLAADDRVDLRRIVKRVEDGEEALARNGENAVAALDPELVDEDLAAGALGHGAPLARGAHSVTPAAASGHFRIPESPPEIAFGRLQHGRNTMQLRQLVYAALGCASLVAVEAPAVAQDQDIVVTRKLPPSKDRLVRAVYIGDLDLKGEAGRTAMEKRVGQAVDYLCEIPSPIPGYEKAMTAPCRDEAWASAKPQMEGALARANKR